MWRCGGGGAEENLLTRRTPCEICKALNRRDSLVLLMEIKQETFVKKKKKMYTDMGIVDKGGSF